MHMVLVYDTPDEIAELILKNDLNGKLEEFMCSLGHKRLLQDERSL